MKTYHLGIAHWGSAKHDLAGHLRDLGLKGRPRKTARYRNTTYTLVASSNDIEDLIVIKTRLAALHNTGSHLFKIEKGKMYYISISGKRVQVSLKGCWPHESNKSQVLFSDMGLKEDEMMYVSDMVDTGQIHYLGEYDPEVAIYFKKRHSNLTPTGNILVDAGYGIKLSLHSTDDHDGWNKTDTLKTTLSDDESLVFQKAIVSNLHRSNLFGNS